MVKTKLKRLSLGKSIPINCFFYYALYKLILSEITIVVVYAESVGTIYDLTSYTNICAKYNIFSQYL
jgi:hypothetical protein